MLLSIGGWTYSPSFHPIVVSPPLRSKFVASAIRLLEDNGLDGLDVDYEYPSNEAQARGYVDLLRELRVALDEHAQRKGANYRFLLTVRQALECCSIGLLSAFLRLLPRVDPTITKSSLSARWTCSWTSGT